MDRKLGETPSGRERIRAILDDRAAAGIGMGDGEAMRLAVSEQHASRRDAWVIYEALASAAVGDLRPDSRSLPPEAVTVLEALAGVFTPRAAHDTLSTPSPLLEHAKPVELLAQGAPGARRVLTLIDALGEGVCL